MKQSILLKLENLCERYDEIAALLSEPEVQSNQNKFRALSQEYAQIGPLVDCYKRYEQAQENLASAKEKANDADPELRELAKEEVDEAQEQIAALLETAQSNVSKLEKQQDMRISTLRRYVQALGGKLKLVAEVKGKDYQLAQFGK